MAVQASPARHELVLSALPADVVPQAERLLGALAAREAQLRVEVRSPDAEQPRVAVWLPAAGFQVAEPPLVEFPVGLPAVPRVSAYSPDAA